MDVDVGEVLDLLEVTREEPLVVGDVRERHEVLARDAEGRAFAQPIVAEPDAHLVQLHERSEVAGHLIAGLPADGEVADFPPVFVVADAPAAHHLDLEGPADRGEEAGQRERAARTVGARDAVAAPLHRERAQAAGARPALGPDLALDELGGLARGAS
jgi:hypothetical protein